MKNRKKKNKKNKKKDTTENRRATEPEQKIMEPKKKKQYIPLETEVLYVECESSFAASQKVEDTVVTEMQTDDYIELDDFKVSFD